MDGESGKLSLEQEGRYNDARLCFGTEEGLMDIGVIL